MCQPVPDEEFQQHRKPAARAQERAPDGRRRGSDLARHQLSQQLGRLPFRQRGKRHYAHLRDLRPLEHPPGTRRQHPLSLAEGADHEQMLIGQPPEQEMHHRDAGIIAQVDVVHHQDQGLLLSDGAHQFVQRVSEPDADHFAGRFRRRRDVREPSPHRADGAAQLAQPLRRHCGGTRAVEQKGDEAADHAVRDLALDLVALDAAGDGALQSRRGGHPLDQGALADPRLAGEQHVAQHPALAPLPPFVEHLILLGTPDEGTVLPLIGPDRGDVLPTGPLPATPPEAERHPGHQLRRLRPQLISQPHPPLLVDL